MAVKINININAEFDKRAEAIKKQKLNKILTALKEATPVDTGRAQNGWKVKSGNIVNDVEYIEELNGGSSRQAPTHFIERTLLSIKDVKANGVIITHTPEES
jgi:hypothetical protein